MHCKLVCLCCISGKGGLSRLSWCGSQISSGDILFMMTLGWVVRAVSIWAALGGGPVCILAIEFSFTEKLARMPGGGGSKVCGLTSRKWVDNLWRTS